MSKKYLFLIFCVLAQVGNNQGFGQNTLSLSGLTVDSSFSANPDVLLNIEIEDTFGSFVFADSLLSDASGRYEFAISLDSLGVELGIVTLFFFDCFGSFISDEKVFSPNRLTFIDTLQTCPRFPPPPCEINFTFDIPNYPTYVFRADTFNQKAGTYVWDFGDGTVAVGPVVTHTFPLGNTYQVCLNYQSTDSSCLASVCKLVEVPVVFPCEANFEVIVDTGVTASLQSTSVGVPPLTYEWTATNGFQSNDENPVFFVADTSFYGINLRIVDAARCTDSEEKSLWIPFNPDSCRADIQFQRIGNFSYSFSPVISQDGRSYNWTFSDGFQASVRSVQRTFPTPGEYEVCLTISDSASPCESQRCIRLLLEENENCQAQFTWQNLGNNQVQFINQSQSVSGSHTPYWKFGDGSLVDSTLNPVHTFPGPGPWEVCLEMWAQQDVCRDTFCQTLDLATQTLFSLSGEAISDEQPSLTGNTYLYQFRGGEFVFEQTNELTFNVYQFDSLSVGGYLVWVREPISNQVIPAYTGGAIFWEEAINTLINQSNVINPPIQMPVKTEQNGPGKIAGQLQWKQSPIYTDWLMILMDETGQVIDYQDPGGVGRYEFDQLPYGTYWLHAERPSSYVSPMKIELRPGEEESLTADIEIRGLFGIPVSKDMGLQYKPLVTVLAGRIMLRADFDPTLYGTYQILDMMGRQVWLGELGSDPIEIPTAHWIKGTYHLITAGKDRSNLMLQTFTFNN